MHTEMSRHNTRICQVTVLSIDSQVGNNWENFSSHWMMRSHPGNCTNIGWAVSPEIGTGRDMQKRDPLNSKILS